MKPKTLKGPRSTALQAFRAKDEEARQRLANIFVAFVKLPFSKKAHVLGYVFIGSNNNEEVGGFESRNFDFHLVGSPPMQVEEVEVMVKTLGFLWDTRVSTKDFHSSSARMALADLNQATLELSQYPRASAVEALFIDKRANADEVQWVSYAGEYHRCPLKSGPGQIVVCGCYGGSRRAEISAIMKTLLRGRITAPRLRAVAQQLKRAAKVRRVQFESVS